MSLVVSTEPTSLVAVEDQCARVEAWAEQSDSVPELRDAMNKLSAISEYLTLTSTEGVARVEAAKRRLEVRIGQVLGPPQQGRRVDLEPLPRAEEVPVPPTQRHEFRQMAAHPDVVEQVIAESTDDNPPSRRQVTEAIKAEKPPAPKPRRTPLPEQAERAGWEFRRAVERIERITADDRFPANREQVAAQRRGHLTYATEVLPDLLRGFDTEPQEAR